MDRKLGIIFLVVIAFGEIYAQQFTNKIEDAKFLDKAINIVEWDGTDLPEIYQRSQQLPLNLRDLKSLSLKGFNDSTIIKMLEERRCSCDASVQSLITLKEKGFSEEVLAAVSLHALPPNRHLNLKIDIDFFGNVGRDTFGGSTQENYFYLIIPDGKRERVFVGNIAEILTGEWHVDTFIDDKNPLLSRKIRRVSFVKEIPLKTYGNRKAIVFTSMRPDIYSSNDLSVEQNIESFSIDYPVSSSLASCNLKVRYRQDAVLFDRWHWKGAYFDCEWN